MRLVPLGSGSNGNATLVEFGKTRLLIDAGLSDRQLTSRLRTIGVEANTLDAILLSHEHQDHARGVERFSRRHAVPVACSLETLEALDLSPVHLESWQPLPASGMLDIGDTVVETFPVPHDAVRPVGFVIHGEGLRVGVALDLGHVTTLVLDRLRGCNLLMVESNHDEKLLSSGPYPWQLKQRVAGRLGHLSNNETAALLQRVADVNCQAVVLAHLSAQNNTPTLARQAARAALEWAGCGRVTVQVAAARAPTPGICL